jgi:hypothetical protein
MEDDIAKDDVPYNEPTNPLDAIILVVLPVGKNSPISVTSLGVVAVKTSIS